MPKARSGREHLEAIADLERNRIMRAMRRRPQSKKALMALVRQSESEISLHLKYLEHAGLITVSAKNGTTKYWSLTEKGGEACGRFRY